MKSRLALTSVLALGILMSGTGATLAISGIADSDNAGVAQYKTDQPDDLLGTVEEGGPEEGGTLGDTQQPRQVSVQTDDGSLPFTGFLAIPLLVGGVALAGTGAVLRRKAGREQS
jgi:hypothetical protein